LLTMAMRNTAAQTTAMATINDATSPTVTARHHSRSPPWLTNTARLSVLPVGALLLRDRGEIDTKIIAVPQDSSLRVFQVDDFLSFALEHDAARNIIETWFLNYKGPRSTELVRWEDEQYAWREVRKWAVDR